MLPDASEGPLLRTLLRAQEADAELLGHPDAAKLVDAILRFSSDHGCSALLAATPAGERIVGAALFAGGGALRLWRPGDADAVLVVDGCVASTAGLRCVMARAARSGALEVHGVAFTLDPGASGAVCNGVGLVLVVDGLPDAA